VGPGGRVYCLDLTDAMLKKLRENARISGADQIIPLRGNAEAIPLPEASVDVITSNGVLNLVPDKGSAFLELFRVMRPGGRLSLADVAVSKDLSTLEEARDNPRLWAECVVGAVDKDQYVAQLEAVGFTEVTIVQQLDYFSHSVSDQTRKIATTFGADSIVLQAVKPDS
jgi:ubiquinone/menaquinone biosynthesis C-methylase UbiE